MKQLVGEGICDPDGLFYTSLCKDDTEFAGCVCHKNGGPLGLMIPTMHGNTVYQLDAGKMNFNLSIVIF